MHFLQSVHIITAYPTTARCPAFLLVVYLVFHSFTHRTASSSKISQREVFSKAQASLQQAGFSQSQDPSPRPRTNFFQKKKIDLRHYLSKVECRHALAIIKVIAHQPIKTTSCTKPYLVASSSPRRSPQDTKIGAITAPAKPETQHLALHLLIDTDKLSARLIRFLSSLLFLLTTSTERTTTGVTSRQGTPTSSRVITKSILASALSISLQD